MLYIIPKGNKGFTLTEVVLAIGVVCMVMAASMVLISKTFITSDVNKITTNLNLVVGGVNEYRIINKSLPSGAGWPSGLNDFVDTGVRGIYSYNCPVAGSINIVTNAGHALTSLTKLQDQNICSSPATGTSSIAQDGIITCRLVAFDGEVCQ